MTTKKDMGRDHEEGNAVANSVGGYSYVVIILSKRRGRVMKGSRKNLAFTDVFRCAKENLERNNMKVTCHSRLVCQEKGEGK